MRGGCNINRHKIRETNVRIFNVLSAKGACERNRLVEFVKISDKWQGMRTNPISSIWTKIGTDNIGRKQIQEPMIMNRASHKRKRPAMRRAERFYRLRGGQASAERYGLCAGLVGLAPFRAAVDHRPHDVVIRGAVDHIAVEPGRIGRGGVAHEEVGAS
jgi:hypothetical protein